MLSGNDATTVAPTMGFKDRRSRNRIPQLRNRIGPLRRHARRPADLFREKWALCLVTVDVSLIAATLFGHRGFIVEGANERNAATISRCSGILLRKPWRS